VHQQIGLGLLEGIRTAFRARFRRFPRSPFVEESSIRLINLPRMHCSPSSLHGCTAAFLSSQSALPMMRATFSARFFAIKNSSG